MEDSTIQVVKVSLQGRRASLLCNHSPKVSQSFTSFSRASATRTPSIKDALDHHTSILHEAKIHALLMHLFPRASAIRTSSMDEALGHHASIPHKAKIHAASHAFFFTCVPRQGHFSRFSQAMIPSTTRLWQSENLLSPCSLFITACTWGVQR
ncbi:UNVERIFIED_CONTAM: hypothetical protein Slati_2934800 [Sesamum latifolium]|uniref:Uncharacterized protein n=1 Tax=Sesamum latifolium TaxID=2727402 RepID=A0AAW2VDC6_9LAMI